MRIFFLFLLLINLLFASWLYTQPDRQPAEIRPLPVGLETIELLKSSNGPQTPGTGTEAASEALVAKPEPVPEKTLHCYTLGPFNEEAALLDIKNQLSEQVAALQVRRREEREPHRYWVYLPPQKSREQAIELGRVLAQKNLKDYYVVRSGENNNALSLGHFREKLHADRRLRQLYNLGFNAEMEVIYRQYSLFWLDYSVAQAQPSTNELIAPYLVNGVARLDRDCE
jgi:hypothetical protein